MCYEPEFALDLAEVAKKAELEPEEVARRHAAGEYRVLMMGFAPGHAYMGGLDPKLAVPRRASPRAVVPAGSVAIANEQTVVYPYAISGGWNVIGRTPMVLFDAKRARPSLLWPGDRVRFRAIDREEFMRAAKTREHPGAPAGAADDGAGPRSARLPARRACARAARWTRWRSRSPTRLSATRRTRPRSRSR